MDSQILFSDLADESGILRAIEKLQKANEKFGDSAVDTNNRIRKSLAELRDDLNKLKLESAAFDNKQQKAAKFSPFIEEFKRLSDAYKNQNTFLAQSNALFNTNSQAIAAMQNRLEELRKEYSALDLAKKDDVKRSKEIQRELTSTTRAVNSLSTATGAATKTVRVAEGSFNALKKQTADLKKSLDNLPNAYDKGTNKINEQNRAAVALNAQYQKNIASINAIERGQKNFRGNVGNYPTAGQSGSALSSIGSFAAGAAGIGSVAVVADKLISGLHSAAQVILQFDSLDSALKVVSDDTNLFTQRQQMLAKISDDLGQDLSVVEKNYTNLTASSKGTRLEGAATDKIFEQIVGTMGRLKKPAEDIDGALLAIGQIMSKGTVQSEELRGQLAERIPNAFGIAAKSIGVTTQKLGDMLKNGEVLASEFLPKFAAELERTFNPNHERRVEGLAANLARLRNEGVEWVKTLDIGNQAGEWIGNITGMAKAVREFFGSAVSESTRKLAEQTAVVEQLESTLPGLLSRYDELGAKAKLSTEEQTELHGIVNQIVSLVPGAATGFDRYGNALDINKGKVLSFASAQRELNAELNKVAINALKDKTAGSMDRANQAQSTLNRGTKQRSFSFMPYGLRSNEDKQRATAKTEAERRSVSLTDSDRRDLSGSLQKENKAIELSIMQRLQLGDKLTEADNKYINYSNNANLKRVKVVEDYNVKIADLDARQADLFIKGDRDSIKKREGVLKELKLYKDKVTAILNPSLSVAKVSPEELVKKEKKKKAEDSPLEALNKEIAKTEALLQSQALQDLKAGRFISVDPVLVERVGKLKAQFEAIKEMQTRIENGTYNKPVDIGSVQPLESISTIGTGRVGKNSKKTVSDAENKATDAKRLAEQATNFSKQTGIMVEYDTYRRRLEYDFNNDLRGLTKERQVNLMNMLAQIEQAERQGDKDEVQRLKDKYAQMSEEDRDYLQKKKQVQEKYFEIGSTLVNGLFEIEQQKNQNALQQVEKNKQYELSLVGDSESAKAAIEQKYAAQSKVLQHQADVNARNQALFQVAISTAVEVSKSLSNPPLAIAVGILGAVQAGIILARGLPTYFAGKNIDGISNDHYSGPAIAGERGRELWHHDGQVDLLNKATLINVGRNDVIYPNHITEHILGGKEMFGATTLARQIEAQSVGKRLIRQREAYQTNLIVNAMGKSGPSAQAIAKALAGEIGKLPFNHTTFDAKGVTDYVIESGNKRIVQRNKHQLGKKG